MNLHYFIAKIIWTAFKNTIIFLLSSFKSAGKCFPQFYFNETFRAEWKGTLDRSWSRISTCSCSSPRCPGDVHIHDSDTQLPASLPGECSSLAAPTAAHSCMDTTCTAHHCKRGQKPLNQSIWNLTRTEEEGRKHSCENSCKTLPLREGQEEGNPCYLLVTSNLCLLILSATKAACRKVLRTPSERNSPKDCHSLQLWWKQWLLTALQEPSQQIQ